MLSKQRNTVFRPFQQQYTMLLHTKLTTRTKNYTFSTWTNKPCTTAVQPSCESRRAWSTPQYHHIGRNLTKLPIKSALQITSQENETSSLLRYLIPRTHYRQLFSFVSLSNWNKSSFKAPLTYIWYNILVDNWPAVIQARENSPSMPMFVPERELVSGQSVSL